MIEIKNKLFKAFAEDHAVLGNGFHILSSKLREGNTSKIKAAAKRLDGSVGAHIAFEELYFYPKLEKEKPTINVSQMYEEHRIGLSVILSIRDLPIVSNDDKISEKFKKTQLEIIEIMEKHVAECGELFTALDTLPTEDLIQLYEKLLLCREEDPKWSGVKPHQEKPSG